MFQADGRTARPGETRIQKTKTKIQKEKGNQRMTIHERDYMEWREDDEPGEPRPVTPMTPEEQAQLRADIEATEAVEREANALDPNESFLDFAHRRFEIHTDPLEYLGEMMLLLHGEDGMYRMGQRLFKWKTERGGTIEPEAVLNWVAMHDKANHPVGEFPGFWRLSEDLASKVLPSDDFDS